jgi:predicted lactoylglutathione lyase
MKRVVSKKNSVNKDKSVKIFVNVPVKNLDKSVKFFKKLGYKFNKQFTDKKAACLVISKDIYVMLLLEKFFKSFIKKRIVNARTDSEVILALSAASRMEVDKMMLKVIKAGGKIVREPDDHGFMYSRSFEDPDGHLWEIFWMDEKYVKKG